MVVQTQVKGKTVSEAQAVSLPLSHWVAFCGVAGVLLISPFFRGLFFPPQQEMALMVAALSFWLVYFGRWLRYQSGVFTHALHWWMLGLPVAYTLSFFVAINQGLAVNEIVKAALYFTVFWAVSRLVTEEIIARWLLNVFFVSGVGVAFGGLLTATCVTGFFFIPDGFLGNRIYSTFQYPNALANYLLCILIFGAYMWVRALQRGSGGVRDVWPGVPAWLERLSFSAYPYVAGNFFVATVFWGSKSNGAFLTLAIVSLLLFLGVPRKNRLPMFLHALQVGIPGFFVALKFINAAIAQKFNAAWAWALLGLLVVVGLQILFDLRLKERVVGDGKSGRMSYWVPVAGIVTLVGAVAVAFVMRPDLWGKIEAALRPRDIMERFRFYRDAIEMIAVRPFLGWGGGGWHEAYRSFQDYLYNSTQVHGYYFQVGVETGIVGLIVVCGIWVAFLLTAHRLYHGAREDTERRFLIWILTVAALGVGIHSAIDFNLSLSALALVLFSIFGMSAGMSSRKETAIVDEKMKKKLRKAQQALNPVPLFFVSVAALVIFAGAFCLTHAGDYAEEAYTADRGRDIEKAIAKIQQAGTYNPFNDEYDAFLSREYLTIGKTKECLDAAKSAVSKSVYNPTRYAELSSVYRQLNQYDLAISNARNAVTCAPFQVGWYENLSRMAFICGYMEVNDKHPEKARKFFEEAVGVPGKISARMAKITPKERSLWVVAPLMTPTPSVQVEAGGSSYFLGRFSDARGLLTTALQEIEKEGISEEETQMYSEGCTWLALTAEKQGDTALKQQSLEKAKKINPQVEGWYNSAAALPVLK